MRNTVRALRAAPRSTRSSATGDVAQGDRPDAARGVQRVQRGDGDAVGRRVDDHDVVAGDQHEHRRVGSAEHRGTLARHHQVGADDHVTGQAERADDGSVGQARKQLRPNAIGPAAVDHHRGGHGRQERAGAQLAALRLEHHRQLRQPEARSAVLLGDRQPLPAEFGGRGPDAGGWARIRRIRVEGGARGLASLQSAQLARHRVGEVAVFVGDG